MMKKLIALSLVILMAFSCEDLAEFNKDIKNPSEVPGGALFANATKDLFDFYTSTNVNVNNFRLWAQFWAQTTYADESNYILNERNQNAQAWNTLYSGVIRDLKEARDFIAEDEFISAENKVTQAAMAEVLEIFSYHILVDLFGDIPYTEAFSDVIVEPAYDDDASIYTDLADRLDAAIADLNADGDDVSGMGGYDLVYGGTVSSWVLFANSLKLKLAVRMLDQTMAEEAIAAGVFTDNNQSFMLPYSSSTPNTNPLWVDLVQSGRSDFIIASTLSDTLNALNDPRRPFYFQDQVGGVWAGGAYGDNNSYSSFSHPGALQEDPTWAGVLISYYEVQFLLADAATRGWAAGGTAESFYNEGITASIVYWGGDEVADAAPYLAQADVAFTTAPGTDLEKIALQKWIALYDQGFEAWSTHRFYDAPTLPIAVQAGIPTPNRYTYPITEYTLNEANVTDASTAIGGDALATRVFWDTAD